MAISTSLLSKQIGIAKNRKKALQYYSRLELANIQPLLGDSLIIFLDLINSLKCVCEFLESFNTPKYSHYTISKVIILFQKIDPEDAEKSNKSPVVIDYLQNLFLKIY